MVDNDLKFLKIAVNQAKKSVSLGGFPAGAIVVKDNKIISRGVSLGRKLNDPTSHAETSSIRQACKKLKTPNLTNCILYASLEPCLMCFQVANWSGISKIIFGCQKNSEMISKNYYEGTNDIQKININNNRQITIKYLPNFQNEIIDLIEKWEVILIKK